MRDLGAEIDRERTLLDGVEVFGEALPLPGDALGQSAARNVLDAFHQFDQPLFAAWRHRRESHSAVPADHGGDAVQARRLQQRIPADLPVVVGVDVDEPRRHDATGGVEGLRGVTL